MNLLVDDTSANSAIDTAIGNKARGLFQLRQAGLPAPPLVVVPVAVVDRCRADDRWSDVVDAVLARADVPPPWAVRSSATDEDGAHSALAGLFDSVLFVDAAGLEAALRRVAASADGPRAAARPRRIDDSAGLAIIVQSMVDGARSGVLFTACPQTGRRDLRRLEAAWGLCEGVVQGSVDTDSVVVRAEGNTVEATIAPKRQRVVRADGGGTRLDDVPGAEQAVAVLNDDEARALCALGDRAAALLGRPVDVEWTWRDGPVLLQVRPITALPSDPGTTPRTWDNANIVESFSGVTAPLTFSYIRDAYAVAYEQSALLNGLLPAELAPHQRTFRTMLGLVDGRVHYNLRSWYLLLSLFPGFEKNRARMEAMMGVRESNRLWGEAQKPTLGRRLRMGRAMLRNFWGIDALVKRFHDDVVSALGGWERTDWSGVSVDDAGATYHQLRQRLLYAWQAPLATDFLAMIFSGLLRELCSRWLNDDGGLANDLLAGEGDLESTAPTRALMRLALRTRAHPALRAQLLATADDDVLPLLSRGDEPARALHDDLQAWLQRFGVRCMEELKLETPTLQEKPGFVVRMLKNYLTPTSTDGLDPDQQLRGEQERRARAEAVVRARVSWPRRALFSFVVRQARKHIKTRESLRFLRTRAFGVLRKVCLRVGEGYAERGVLDDARDVFFLEVSEVFGFLDGTATCPDLRGLAAVRRAAWQAQKERPDPLDRFTTEGPVGLADAPRPRAMTAGQRFLRGTPCAPGVVRGRVRVVTDPTADLALDGEILVARRTDPGWVPLFPSVRGLLVERGSVLSHSAIVARELGLPTIVNIEGLTDVVKDGDWVEMDAAAGTVHLIDSPSVEALPAAPAAPAALPRAS